MRWTLCEKTRIRSGPVRFRLLVVVLVSLRAGCSGGDGEKSDAPERGSSPSPGAASVIRTPLRGRRGTSDRILTTNVTFDQAVEQVTKGGGGMPVLRGPFGP
jgi:hypothetical protein